MDRSKSPGGGTVRRIAACDIGGTHARFCIATVGGGSPRLGEPVTLKTGDFPGFAEAFLEFARGRDGAAISDCAIAFAGPVGGEALKLTNSSWVIRPDDLAARLGLERLSVVNDFGAVAHAVAVLDPAAFRHLCGPDVPLPDKGAISVVGPGTGLGAAILLRRPGGRGHVIETEAGHIGFAPLDEVEDRMLAKLRARFGRVSVERLASGPGLANIHAAMNGAEPEQDERRLWASALDGSDRQAVEALDQFCMVLGAVAGDLALAQGAEGVVIAGGLGRRLIDRLPGSRFGERFAAKGRFRERIEALPVKMLDYPEPGLLGAAAAFVQEHI